MKNGDGKLNYSDLDTWQAMMCGIYIASLISQDIFLGFAEECLDQPYMCDEDATEES